MWPSLTTWLAYTLFAFNHHVMTYHAVNFRGSSVTFETLLSFYAFARRVLKLVFLAYYAWTLGILACALLLATSFPIKVLLWRFTPRGPEWIISVVGLVTLPLLAWVAMSSL